MASEITHEQEISLFSNVTPIEVLIEKIKKNVKDLQKEGE
jgi:hypothetical protein